MEEQCFYSINDGYCEVFKDNSWYDGQVTACLCSSDIENKISRKIMNYIDIKEYLVDKIHVPNKDMYVYENCVVFNHDELTFNNVNYSDYFYIFFVNGYHLSLKYNSKAIGFVNLGFHKKLKSKELKFIPNKYFGLFCIQPSMSIDELSEYSQSNTCLSQQDSQLFDIEIKVKPKSKLGILNRIRNIKFK